jgi:hypothetical protein
MFDANVKDWDTMIDTNIKGLLYVTRLILPGMIERGRGHIINIGSIGAFELYPGGNVYCASKSAVQTLSKTLRMDVLGKSIRVTNISPGMTKTEFPLVRWGGDKQAADKIYEGIDYLTPEDVGEAILFCATCPPHVNIGELTITPTDQISFMLTIEKVNKIKHLFTLYRRRRRCAIGQITYQELFKDEKMHFATSIINSSYASDRLDLLYYSPDK